MQNESTGAAPKSFTNRILCFSACILALILLVQMGLLERSAFARGADVASSGEYTVLTLRTSNEDVLFVLDGRNESLSVYHVRNQSMFEAVTSGDLKALFARGRRIGAGIK